MTRSLSEKRHQSAISSALMTRKEQIEYHLSALRQLGVAVNVTCDIANAVRPIAAKASKPKPSKARTDHNGKQYVSRTSLNRMVEESEYTVTARLTGMGHMQCVQGRYILTEKGKSIGRQNNVKMELHIDRTVKALRLTLKQ